MIRFVKSIKKYISGKPKLTRYLLYAGGEIILLSIGVFLALQVNNWNALKDEEETAVGYLRSMTNELKLDIANYNEYLGFLQEQQDRKRRLLSKTAYADMSLDSLVYLIQPFLDNQEIIDETFHKLNTEKFTRHIENEALLFKINSYYTDTRIKYSSFNTWDEEYTLKESEFWYYNPTFETTYLDEEFPFINTSEEQKQALTDQISSIKGRNMLRIYLFRKKRIQLVVNQIKEEALSLVDAIDTYLEKNTS